MAGALNISRGVVIPLMIGAALWGSHRLVYQQILERCIASDGPYYVVDRFREKRQDCRLIQAEDKISRLEQPADVAFIGDSTVHDSIDEAQFQQLSGMSALNLGTTSAFWFSESYYLLKRLEAMNKPPKVVVMWRMFESNARAPIPPSLYALVHPGLDESYDIHARALSRELAYNRYVTPFIDRVMEDVRSVLIKFPGNMARSIFSMHALYRFRDAIYYFASGPAQTLAEANPSEDQSIEYMRRDQSPRYSEETIGWVKRVVELTHRNGGMVVAAQPPLKKYYLDRHGEALQSLASRRAAQAQEMYREAGVDVVILENPVFDDVGDLFHPGEKGRREVTQVYAELMRRLPAPPRTP